MPSASPMAVNSVPVIVDAMGIPERAANGLSEAVRATAVHAALTAMVAPDGMFDPAAALVEGAMTVEGVGGVEVYVTRGSPDVYAVVSVGWKCGGYVWFIDFVWGMVDELVDWAAAMIGSAGCAGG